MHLGIEPITGVPNLIGPCSVMQNSIVYPTMIV
jgi:hypothetical protein